MSTAENIPTASLWKPRPLPTQDCFLLQILGISYYDLVFADYKLVWELIAKQQLNAKEVQRVKHIRKREKNKLFSRGQFHTLEEAIGNLLEEKNELLLTRDKMTQECEYWEKMHKECIQMENN
ncbi:hypothetical protein LOD99_11591 [Oopsacas minuta]|uniref:Uncharacterized protein n=1 Tax=Oopsacas minuta TaxID=111878 RepID=A0AAV7JLD0_9METZ|nr:hypothetical protein LOD99_11591 [Oopsacas minuta]